MNKKKVFTFVALLVVTLAASFVFCFIDKDVVGPCGTAVGMSHLNVAFRNLCGYTDTTTYSHLWYLLTQLLGYAALLVCACFGLIGLAQLIGRKSLKKVDRNILALAGLYVITIALYVLFDKVAFNYRPILMAGEINPEPSFPSSHTLLAVVVYCSAPMVLKKYLGKKPMFKVICAVFYILTAVMVVGRLLSGVHWFTDIVAGVLMGATLLAGYAMVIDALKPGKKSFYID